MPLPILPGHGASGTAASMRPHLESLRQRGIQAIATDLAKGRAERAVPADVERLRELKGPALIGGHVASTLVASDAGDAAAGLVMLSYPLHRPGHSEEQRTGHGPDTSPR